MIDAIGQVGYDPGSQWGFDPVSTADNILRRKMDVCAGDTNQSDTFDPSIEWDGFAYDNFDDLGTHTANCGSSEAIPTLNEWGLIMMGLLLAGATLFIMKRRQTE